MKIDRTYEGEMITLAKGVMSVEQTSFSASLRNSDLSTCGLTAITCTDYTQLQGESANVDRTIFDADRGAYGHFVT